MGIKQNIEEIGKLLRNYNCYFHVDATQSIGKVNINFEDVDLVSFSAHKIYGLKGIGCLIKKEKNDIIPLINGGKSTTVYRSGTQDLPLKVSLAKALQLALENLDDKIKYVDELNKYLRENIKNIENIKINSNENAIPHILNISVLNIKPETMLHALEEDDIYISTQSACSSNNPVSKAVLEVTKDELSARHSIRISISHITTKEEIDYFISSLKKQIERLSFK